MNKDSIGPKTTSNMQFANKGYRSLGIGN